MTAPIDGAVLPVLTAYISLWNERDPRTRRALGTKVFTPTARYLDPNGTVEGRSAIDDYIGGWQRQFAGMTFHLGQTRGHHDTAHFFWRFSPPGAAPVGEGWDVVVLDHGKIDVVYGFFA